MKTALRFHFRAEERIWSKTRGSAARRERVRRGGRRVSSVRPGGLACLRACLRAARKQADTHRQTPCGAALNLYGVVGTISGTVGMSPELIRCSTEKVLMRMVTNPQIEIMKKTPRRP